MRFEDYLAEDGKGKSMFAIKILGKWHEDQPLPFKDITSLIRAVNSEKDDVSSLSEFFHKNYRVSGGGVEIIDMVAEKKGSTDAKVTIAWTTTNDRHQTRKTDLEVAPA